LIILRYHSIGDPSNVGHYLSPGLCITPERFRFHVRFLVQNFQVVLLDQIPSLVSKETRTRATVAITFDDGFRDNHDIALPILLEEGAVATFFICTQPFSSGRGLWFSELWRLVFELPEGPLDLPPAAPSTVRKGYQGRNKLYRDLTIWLSGVPVQEREDVLDQLARLADVPRGAGLENSFLAPKHVKAMRRAGMTIGAHTRSHPHLDRLDPIYHDEEVIGGRKDLEEMLGETVHHFTYPNPGGGGVVLPAVRRTTAKAGFLTAGTSAARSIEEKVDLLRLPRIGVYPGEPERLLFRILRQIVDH